MPAARRLVAATPCFTLVELLVVIAIISILAGMLLPALQRARKSALAAQCLGNERQFGIAFNLYADDFENQLPMASATGNASPYWMHCIVNAGLLPRKTGSDLSVGELGVWHCPANSVQKQAFGSNPKPEENSYGINGYASYTGNYQTNNFNVYKGFAGAKFSNIRAPSRKYAIMDAADYRIAFDGNTGKVGTVVGLYFPTGANQADHRHNMALNMLFADAHAEALKGPLQTVTAPVNYRTWHWFPYD